MHKHPFSINSLNGLVIRFTKLALPLLSSPGFIMLLACAQWRAIGMAVLKS